MHEIIEGLRGVEVIADDFLIIQYGDTQEDAIRDHDANLTKFLQRTREKGQKLNPEKTKLRRTEAIFVGHEWANRGVAPDPRKIEAIIKMPTPASNIGNGELFGKVLASTLRRKCSTTPTRKERNRLEVDKRSRKSLDRDPDTSRNRINSSVF